MVSLEFSVNSTFFSIAKAVSVNFSIIFCLILLIVTSSNKISSPQLERRHLEGWGHFLNHILLNLRHPNKMYVHHCIPLKKRKHASN